MLQSLVYMPSLDIDAIRDILPHRYPFLLVDRILEMEPHRIVGIKNVTANASASISCIFGPAAKVGIAMRRNVLCSSSKLGR